MSNEKENIKPPKKKETTEDVFSSNTHDELEEELIDEEKSRKKNTNNISNSGQLSVHQGIGDIIYSVEKNYDPPSEFKLEQLENLKFKLSRECKIYANSLLKIKLLIINCSHDEIVESIKQTIARDDRFKSYLKYNTFYDDYEDRGINHLINYNVENLLSKKDKKLLLFINEKRSNETPLLNYFKKITVNGKKDIIDKLSDSFYIIYFTYHKNLGFLANTCFENNFYAIPTYEIYKKAHPVIYKNKLLQKEIRAKRADGYLSADEKEFLLELDKKIKDDDFEDYISNLGEDSIEFNNLLKDKNRPLARYLLLVATLFHRLSPESFREYVHLLIQDKKKVKVNGSKISLSQLWDEDADIILEECGLKSYEIDNQYCIDFATSKDAERCKNVMYKYANFMDQKSRLLIEQKQLFNESTSIDSHDKIFIAIAHLATLFKSYYGNKLISKWLMILETQREEVFRLISVIDDLRSYRHHIQKLINKVSNIHLNEDLLHLVKKVDPIKFKNEYKKYFDEHQLAKFLFYREEQLPENISVKDVLVDLGNLKNDLLSRTSDANDELNIQRYGLGRNIYLFVNLLQDIHNIDKAKTIILDFFNTKFQSLYRNFIVLDILNEFQSKTKIYNFFEYYKQSLEKASRNSTDIVTDAFVRFILKNPSEFYTTVSKMKDWFPKASKPTEEFSQLEKLSLRCLYHSLIIQMNIDNELSKDDIINSNTYQMLFENSKELHKDIGYIIVNVFKYPDVLEASIKKKGLEVLQTVENCQYEVAQLFQSWYLLLHKLDNQNTEKEKYQAKVPLLVNTIQDVLSSNQHKVLIKNLKENREHFNRQIITSKNRKEKKKIKEKRGSLIKLINLLNK